VRKRAFAPPHLSTFGEDMDFTVIARAGLTQAEFSALVGVGRVTTNTWVRGKMHPHRYIKARITAVLGCLESAIEHKDLPLADGVQDRLAAVRRAVKSAMIRANAAA
jgi:DNA-binding XRE family transcriptional regulator